MQIENHDADGSSVSVTLTFSPDELTLSRTPFGVVVQLEETASGGEPGAPALPHAQLSVAVPESYWPGSLAIVEEQWEQVADAGTLVVPAQRLRPGVDRLSMPAEPPGRPDAPHEREHFGYHCDADCSCRRPQRPDRAPVGEALPAPEMTPPDPDAYAAAAERPLPVVRAVRIDSIGSTRIAVVAVAPMRLGRAGELELCTRVQFVIEGVEQPRLADRDRAVAEFSERFGDDFDIERVVIPPEHELSDPAEEAVLREFAIAQVINPQIIGRPDPHRPMIDLPSRYLIITDDCTWDADMIEPGVARPGMVAEFERLASAKRARGISARVVTITDIVDGRWGDVASGARDLQEVIRRFLKVVRKRWGVTWLLLGGDIDIVPVRTVAGSMEGEIATGKTNPPDERNSFWTGSYLRIHAAKLGAWWAASAANKLVRQDSGQVIPYDLFSSASSSSPGWYFTTADDYKTRSTKATDFVRVEGPNSLLNAPLQFLYAWNTLPTDLYYASLSSWVTRQDVTEFDFFTYTVSYAYVPLHDWDASGNGIYGQHRKDGTDLDGVILHTDLSVGRAPVEFSSEAAAFVDKTLAYERLGGSFPSSDREWPRTMLLASSDWGGRTVFRWRLTSVPAANEYIQVPSASRALLHMAEPPTSFDFELIARVTDSDRRVLPYKTDPNPNIRGWYFATSATNTSPHLPTIVFFWGSITWPQPTAWIVVHGSPADRSPAAYELNPNSAEGSMVDQESLRRQVAQEIPGIDRFDRYYEDEFDLPLSARLAAPVDYLSRANLQAGLNAAPHIVSLSGHGSGDGCCDLSVAMADGLTNGRLGFIAYADSCLTNQFDRSDAMGEALVKNPNGGAVAYVGNTRFSWIGVGDDYQRAFFHRLRTTRHLGLLHDSRIAVYGTTHSIRGYDRWAIFALNLLGDPELRVYRSALPKLQIERASSQLDLSKIRIVAEHTVPVGPPVPGDPWPVENVLVSVRSGEREFSARTDDDGVVVMPDGLLADGEWEITASHDDFAVAAQTLGVDHRRPDRARAAAL